MRILDFEVNGQIITKKADCNFSNIVAGSEGYLQARFDFSPEWDNCVKVAAFYYGRTEFPPQVIGEDNTCDIPAEALVNSMFHIQVIGQRKGYKISTNKVIIEQDGGKV